MMDAVVRLLPDGFVTARCDRPGTENYDVVYEVRAAENVRPALPFVENGDHYYSVAPMGIATRTWSSVYDSMLSCAMPGRLRTILVPTRVTSHEREVLSQVRTFLRYYSQPTDSYDSLGQHQRLPADDGAVAALAELKHLNFNDAVLTKTVIEGGSIDASTVAHTFGATLCSTAAPHEQTTRPGFVVTPAVLVADVDAGCVQPDFQGDVWRRPRPPFSLQRLAYLRSEESAAALLMLPVPTLQGCSGLPLSRRLPTPPPRPPVPSERVLVIGRTADAGAQPVAMALDSLTSHALVAGRTDSGKTVTVKSLLVQLHEQGVPWLVLDPKAIPEYRDLLRVPGLADQLRVRCVGGRAYAPVRLNPLALPEGESVDDHISSLMDAFTAAMSLFEPLPELLQESLYALYARFGVDGLQPTLRDLLESFDEVFVDYPFRGDAAGMAHSMRLRLNNLTLGAAGSVLCSSESSDWDELLGGPMVLEIGALSKDQANLLTTFLLQVIQRRARARGQQRRLQHVVVLEEAHRLLRRAEPGTHDSNRLASVEAIATAIAELRATGQGFIVVDQSPVDLHPAVLRNTATKILHRLEEASERDHLLAGIDATDEDKLTSSTIGRGEGYFRGPADQRPVMVSVTPPAAVLDGDPVRDHEVAAAAAQSARLTEALLPLSTCSRLICKSGCDTLTRDASQQAAARLARSASLETAVSLARRNAMNSREAFCVLSHANSRLHLLKGEPGNVIADMAELAMKSADD